MTDHPLTVVAAVLAAIVTAVVAAIATRVPLLPDVIDLSLIPTGAGWAASSLSATERRGASSTSASDGWPCSARSSVEWRPPQAC